MNQSMPSTSVTLLKALAGEAPNVRWAEFVGRYEEVMRSYVARFFPAVDADDVLQNVFVSLMKALPEYRYMPDEKGHFRNYLLGVVKHKALDAVRKSAAESRKREGYAIEWRCSAARCQEEDGEWRDSLMHVALDQMMLDESISPRNREVFRHLVLMGEPPELVAADFGITRGNVDVIKNRLVARLKAMVGAMLAT